MLVEIERAQRIAELGYEYEAEARAKVRACDVCEATEDLVTFASTDRYGFPLASLFCRVCGHIQSADRLHPIALARFYQSIYRPLVSAYHGRPITPQTIQDEQRLYARDLLGWLGCQDVRGRLLDIGGSTGVVARAFVEQYGFAACVVDPAADETLVAAELGIQTITARIEQVQLKDNHYDLVLICQTLDHAPSAYQMLAKAADALHPDGVLFVDVVDVRAVMQRAKSVTAALKIDHCHGFTDLSARTLMERVGLHVRRARIGDDGIHLGYECIRARYTRSTRDYPKPSNTASWWNELRKMQAEWSAR